MWNKLSTHHLILSNLHGLLTCIFILNSNKTNQKKILIIVIKSLKNKPFRSLILKIVIWVVHFGFECCQYSAYVIQILKSVQDLNFWLHIKTKPHLWTLIKNGSCLYLFHFFQNSSSSNLSNLFFLLNKLGAELLLLYDF